MREIPRVQFGGSSLLRGEKRDVGAWKARRAGRIFLVGAACEGVNGNQSVHWDGTLLRMRLPGGLGGKHVVLDGVGFRYGQAEVLAALQRNADEPQFRVGLTWLLFRDEWGRWHAHVTVEEPAPALVTDLRAGGVAVDVNVDHLAVVRVDHHGNSAGRHVLPFPMAGTPEGVATAMIGDACKALSLVAKRLRLGIACEDLEFSKKKADLREYGKAHARRLSGFAFAKFFTMLAARCRRDGVDLHAVNPAYTSVIGRLKYAPGLAMSAHHAAALVIGRRAMGFAERLVSNGASTLDGPARNRPRTEWRRWRSVKRLRGRAKAGPPSTVVGTGNGERGSARAVATEGLRARRRGTPNAPVQVGGAVAPATVPQASAVS